MTDLPERLPRSGLLEQFIPAEAALRLGLIQALYPMNTAVIVVFFGGSLLFGFLRGAAEMGLCVLAGFLALAFLNSDKIVRFKAAGFEAEMRDRVEAVIEKETEPDVRERESGDRLEAYGLVGDESPRIVKALMNPTYTWRHVSGISEESGASREKVLETLAWLMKNELAKSSQAATGRVWALTRKGRDVFASLSN